MNKHLRTLPIANRPRSKNNKTPNVRNPIPKVTSPMPISNQ